MGHPDHNNKQRTLMETFHAVKGKTLVHRTGALEIKTMEDFSLALRSCMPEAIDDVDLNRHRPITQDLVKSVSDEIIITACAILKKKTWLGPGPYN